MEDRNEVTESRLSNGIRLVTETYPGVKSTSVGIWVNVGSRDESSDLRGSSHFLEHLVFKGTMKRTARAISTVLENRGGYLNAFTDRDMTCFHAKVLKQDTELAIDVLLDLVKSPILNQDDFKNELRVILSEINRRDDDPSDLIHDLYFQTCWGKNWAAHSILGDYNDLENMNIDMIRNFYNNHYSLSNMVVTASGVVDHEQILKYIEEQVPNKISSKLSKLSTRKKPKFNSLMRNFSRKSNQVQVAISSEGLPYSDPNKNVMGLINSYLGIGASSKLFQEIRERRGLAYSIYSIAYSLNDAGLFTIFAGTLDKNVPKLIKIIIEELMQLEKGISSKKLEEVKHKSTGLMVLRSESHESRMIQLGVSTLRQGRPLSMKEVINEINSVEREQIMDLARILFNKDKFALTTLGLSRGTLEKTNEILKI